MGLTIKFTLVLLVTRVVKMLPNIHVIWAGMAAEVIVYEIGYHSDD